MARVFIAYNRADKDIVLPLKNQIEKALSEPCWMDMEGIESDAHFTEVITGAIDEASILVFMYSVRHTAISDYSAEWTIRELIYAHQKGKRIVFVDIDQTPLDKWFTFMFPQHQMIDASSPVALKRLMSDLRTWLPEDKNDPKEKQTRYTEGLNYYYFGVIGKEATVTGIGNASEADVVIPPVVTIDGHSYKVTKILGGAFSDCHQLKSIIIPDSVTSIGSTAFSGCINLQSVTLPRSIKEIKFFTFSDCSSLKSIEIPEGVTTIGRHAFSDCSNLKTVIFPKSLKKIKGFAFSECKQLQLPAFPSSVSVSKRAKGFSFLID